MIFNDQNTPDRRSVLLAGLAMLLSPGPGHAASLAKRFRAHVKSGGVVVDHSGYERLLQKYVVASKDGINRVRYKAFKATGHAALRAYIAMLERASVARMSRDGQFAFWVNLYNAKTLDVVLGHYPVSSIQKINLGGGFLARGPWKKTLLRVGGTALSLDDIEHQILRPLWHDPRIHYAVNCASLGCPNLQRKAYCARRLERQLNRAARGFINHRRAVHIKPGGLSVSKLYKWYAKDFGGRRNLAAHWRRYADAPLKLALRRRIEHVSFEYDWRLNDV